MVSNQPGVHSEHSLPGGFSFHTYQVHGVVTNQYFQPGLFTATRSPLNTPRTLGSPIRVSSFPTRTSRTPKSTAETTLSPSAVVTSQREEAVKCSASLAPGPHDYQQVLCGGF